MPTFDLLQSRRTGSWHFVETVPAVGSALQHPWPEKSLA
jgi:hypothetical protein